MYLLCERVPFACGYGKWAHLRLFTLAQREFENEPPFPNWNRVYGRFVFYYLSNTLPATTTEKSCGGICGLGRACGIQFVQTMCFAYTEPSLMRWRGFRVLAQGSNRGVEKFAMEKYERRRQQPSCCQQWERTLTFTHPPFIWVSIFKQVSIRKLQRPLKRQSHEKVSAWMRQPVIKDH